MRETNRCFASAFLLGMLMLLPAIPASASEPLSEAPTRWYENDRNDIPEPAPRNPNHRWDMVRDAVLLPRQRAMNPVRNVRKIGGFFGGDHVPPAANINALDEVLGSSWFNYRMGMYDITPEEAALGPGGGDGPSRDGKWVVVSAKTQGVTPGFNIRDAEGQVYVIKFDPPGYLGMTTAAAVISGVILHACGYNTPEDAVVTFSRDDIVLGDGVKIKTGGTKRRMTDADLDEILNKVDRMPDGRWLAIASKFLSGKPMGPFNYYGRRDDDPNDHIDHEHRRELRGLYVFAGWINHYDTKQHNSLDMYVTENGKSFIRHHLIDFASTLGAGASGPVPRYGYEYTLDWTAILGRTVTVGLREDPWRKQTQPEGLEQVVGFFVSDVFEPDKFNPLQPNTAFENLTDRDGYWAAKIIASFSDAHLKAIVDRGGYQLPGAAEYITRMLGERRDKVARYYFDRIAPLDFFTWRDEGVEFRDLGADYNIYPGTSPRYRVRVSTADADRSRGYESGWLKLDGTRIPAGSGALAEAVSRADDAHRFVGLELQVDRGDGWSDSVTAYASVAQRRIVAIDR